MTYRVHQIIQNKVTCLAPALEEPVSVQFYNGDNHAEALSALVLASVHTNDTYYRVLSVTIAFEE